MGGLQKVTSVIADSLASKFEVSILSMEQTPSFFKLSIPLETISFTERKLSWGFRKIITKFRYEVVLTDKLHGMIFSYITGTPCIVLANDNHKIEKNIQTLDNVLTHLKAYLINILQLYLSVYT
ncbi:polysaccharide pyruvyl transferase family protein [Streptococcus thermophilus]|nr:polysaccharide pyruvyl transferase family protein [Streptococcus thermophilus]